MDGGRQETIFYLKIGKNESAYNFILSFPLIFSAYVSHLAASSSLHFSSLSFFFFPSFFFSTLLYSYLILSHHVLSYFLSYLFYLLLSSLLTISHFILYPLLSSCICSLSYHFSNCLDERASALKYTLRAADLAIRTYKNHKPKYKNSRNLM